MGKRQYYLVILRIVFAFLFVFAICSIDSDNEYPKAKVCGVPNTFAEYSDLTNLSVDQILVEGDKIYILYGEHQGVIQVFDINGVYQYSVSFYDHMNGAFSMAVDDGALYVRDCVHNVYILRDGELCEFYISEAVPEWITDLDFTVSAENYRVRLGSIWYLAEGEQCCVVRRPIVAALYQDNLIFLLTILVVLLIGVRKGLLNKNTGSGSKDRGRFA